MQSGTEKALALAPVGLVKKATGTLTECQLTGLLEEQPSVAPLQMIDQVDLLLPLLKFY